MKDIFYWRKYDQLKKTFRDVDYDTLIEEDDLTSPQMEIACAGGACSL